MLRVCACDALHVARFVVSLWWFCFSVALKSSKLNERCERDNALSFCTGRGLFICLKVSGRTAAHEWQHSYSHTHIFFVYLTDFYLFI